MSNALNLSKAQCEASRAALSFYRIPRRFQFIVVLQLVGISFQYYSQCSPDTSVRHSCLPQNFKCTELPKCRNRRHRLHSVLHCHGNSGGCRGPSTSCPWRQRICSFKFLYRLVQCRRRYWSFSISYTFQEAICRTDTFRILIIQFTEMFFKNRYHFNAFYFLQLFLFWITCWFALSYIRDRTAPSIGRQQSNFFFRATQNTASFPPVWCKLHLFIFIRF